MSDLHGGTLQARPLDRLLGQQLITIDGPTNLAVSDTELDQLIQRLRLARLK